jgi:hypothetical protein
LKMIPAQGIRGDWQETAHRQGGNHPLVQNEDFCP